MTFDRSKWAGTKMSNLKEQEEDLAQHLPTKKKKEGTSFLKLVEGKNRIRIYPAHPGTESFCVPKATVFLDVEVTYKKDGKEVTEIKRKPIFNAKVHGGGKLKIDPVSLYRDIVFKEAGDIQDEAERKKYLKPITDFVAGIMLNTKWVVYADLSNSEGEAFGLIDLPVSVKDAMNALAIEDDDIGEVITVDPFSDPDEGRVLIVTHDKQKDEKKKDPQKYYTTAIDYKRISPLTDDQLKNLMKLDSLDLLLNGAYCRRDFDMAVEGLKRFDEKHGFEVFSDDSFLSALEELSDQLPEDPRERVDGRQRKSTEVEEDEETSPSPEKEIKKTKIAESKAQEPTLKAKSDLPFDKALEEMSREELKGYITRKKLEIKIMARYTDADIVDIIREEEGILAQNQEGLDEEAEEEDPIPEETVVSRRRPGSRLSELSED